jgi:hypothetical protein
LCEISSFEIYCKGEKLTDLPKKIDATYGLMWIIQKDLSKWWFGVGENTPFINLSSQPPLACNSFLF